MIKRFAARFAFIFLMTLLFLTLVSNAFPADKTFTLTINSKDIIVKLPNDLLPPMENAIYKGESCFNLIVCRQIYRLVDPDFVDFVDFVYKDNADNPEVIAVVWTKTLENVYVAWKYVDGLPILVDDISDINKLITDAEKVKESKRKTIFGPKPPPVFIEFTYEGELNPDDFTKWKIWKTKPSLSGFIWVYWQNPDANSPIKIVAGEVFVDGTLIVYRYFKNGRPYMFFLDSEKNKYIRHKFTDDEKKSCMKCHESEVEHSKVLKEV